MTESDLIEAAARAMYELEIIRCGKKSNWPDITLSYWRKRAEAALRSTGIPLERLAQIASGQAWIAPNQPTGAMQADGRDKLQEWLPQGRVAKPVTDQCQIAREVWRAMRDRYLTPDEESSK